MAAGPGETVPNEPISLNVFLIKEALRTADEILQNSRGLLDRELRVADHRLGTLYIKPPRQHPAIMDVII
jgi:hypothetical protein